MQLTTAMAIYFLIWWITLFVVLPFGVQPQHEGGAIAKGTDPGAPATPRLLAKLLWTSVISAILFSACYVLYVWRIVTLDDLARWLHLP